MARDNSLISLSLCYDIKQSKSFKIKEKYFIFHFHRLMQMKISTPSLESLKQWLIHKYLMKKILI